MQRHHHQFDNGLTVIGEYSDRALTLAAGFFVRTGSRDEQLTNNGVSHFLEHMMFKGTQKRSAEDVNREFDEMGANYNAFTSEEATVYYGNVLPHFQEKLLDLLADMMRPELRQEDFEMEKNVILEEIAMYEDQPQFVIYELARAAYYRDHPLGASIIGTTEGIKNLSREQMQEYFSQRYAANNLTLVLTGKYDWPSAIEQIEELCSGWDKAPTPRDLQVHLPLPQTKVETTDRFNRAHLMQMAPGFSAQDQRCWAAAVACEAIGAESGSRLYWEIVHSGLAEVAEIGHEANDGDGVYYSYVLCDPDNVSEVLMALWHVIRKASDGGLNPTEIARAKRRITSRVVLGAETPMGRLRAVGFDWLYRKEQKTLPELLQMLDDVSTDDVNNALALHPFERATTVALGPMERLGGNALNGTV